MKTKVVFATFLFVLFAAGSKAQEVEKRFGFELNGGVSVATNELNETNLNTGFGFEGIFHYRFLPHTGVYGGWGWNSFGADNSFAGNDVNFEETGYILGLQYKRPFGNSPVQYFFRAGGLYNHIEIENEEGDIIEDSGHGLDWQLAAGIDLPLGNNWSFTPGIKFNSLSREIDWEESTSQLDYNYLTFRVGFLKRF